MRLLRQQRGDRVFTDLGGIVDPQKLGQARARAVHAALDRADCAAANLRRLLVREALGPDEQKRLALIGGKLGKRGPEIGKLEMAILLGENGKRMLVGFVRVVDLASELPVLREENVAQDREQPGAEVRPRREKSMLFQALTRVSCTRSSARAASLVKERANALK